MFQFEQDAAARAGIIQFRYRPERLDYTTDTRADWCIARFHSLPNRFPAADYDRVLRLVSGAGLWMSAVNEPEEDDARAALAAEYVALIGYDPFEDEPSLTVESVRQTLAEYKAIAAIDSGDSHV